MDYRRFGNQIVLRVDRDEEVMTEITALCEKENIRLASISGLGAADHLVMGLYDVEAQKFTETVLDCTWRYGFPSISVTLPMMAVISSG